MDIFKKTIIFILLLFVIFIASFNLMNISESSEISKRCFEKGYNGGYNSAFLSEYKSDGCYICYSSEDIWNEKEGRYYRKSKRFCD